MDDLSPGLMPRNYPAWSHPALRHIKPCHCPPTADPEEECRSAPGRHQLFSEPARVTYLRDRAASIRARRIEPIARFGADLYHFETRMMAICALFRQDRRPRLLCRGVAVSA